MNYRVLLMLRPQDVLVACKIHLLGKGRWTFATLSKSLQISVGEIHNAYVRGKDSKLVVTVRNVPTVSRKHLFELVTVAVPRVFYAVKGPIVSGLPTSIYAAPVRERFAEPEGGGTSVVWESVSAVARSQSVKGESLAPIYPTVPSVALRDPSFYELFALIDVVRVGSTPDRKIARSMLEKLILAKDVEEEA
jgi:hypothetical protein